MKLHLSKVSSQINFLVARITPEGITSKIQCFNIGNEHVLALDDISVLHLDVIPQMLFPLLSFPMVKQMVQMSYITALSSFWLHDISSYAISTVAISTFHTFTCFELLRLQEKCPSSFLIFCNRMYVNKSKRVDSNKPLLHFSALCDIFRKKNSKISYFFQKMFCDFGALDIAPTWTGSGLFSYDVL